MAAATEAPKKASDYVGAEVRQDERVVREFAGPLALLASSRSARCSGAPPPDESWRPVYVVPSSPALQLLKAGGGTVSTDEALKGKQFVCVYFSAHWCGPCRAMTPRLSQAFRETAEAAGFAVIFCSLDRKEGDFNAYFGEMPWLAIPWDAPEREKLPGDFSVMGIPCMSVISLTDGHVVKKDICREVASSGTFAGHVTEEMREDLGGSWCSIQ